MGAPSDRNRVLWDNARQVYQWSCRPTSRGRHIPGVGPLFEWIRRLCHDVRGPSPLPVSLCLPEIVRGGQVRAITGRTDRVGGNGGC